MATIRKDAALPVPVAEAWAVLRDVGNAHDAFPGALAGCRLDGDCRIVTFANGLVVRERIITIDDAQRRIAYGVLRDDLVHHSASMQVRAADHGCVFEWITDVLPADLAGRFDAAMETGIQALRRRFGAGSPSRAQAE